MVRQRPGDEFEFLEVHGVGNQKAARYGEIFLRTIRGFLSTGECPGE